MKADDATEKEVTAIIYEFAKFLSERDLEGIESLIVPDSDIIVIGAGMDEKRTGFNEIKTQFESFWAQFEDIYIVFKLISISTSGAVAWVTVDALYELKIEERNLVCSCYVTMILEKRGEKWLFVHVHHSVPVPELPHSDAIKHLSQL